MKKTSVTTTGWHDLPVGSVVCMRNKPISKIDELKRLLIRPRIHYISESTETTLRVRERRPTWAEWFGAIWYVIKN